MDRLPASSVRQALVEPVFEVMEGWSASTRGARSWADLPATAVKYIRRIEEMIEAPVHLLFLIHARRQLPMGSSLTCTFFEDAAGTPAACPRWRRGAISK